jgi:DNA-binding GntR family transcriptional regulator
MADPFPLAGLGNHRGPLLQTKVDAVVDVVREAIITGRLMPGQHIGQLQLAQQLNVSATPIREAMRKLEAVGILNHEAHRGARVPVRDPTTASEIYQVRALLEGMAIEYTVRHISPAHLAEAEELAYHEMPAAVERGAADQDYTAFRSLNYQFHRLLLEASGLECLPDLAKTLWAAVPVATNMLVMVQLRPRMAVDEHVDIIRAVRAGDGGRARALVETHVDRSRQAYLTYLKLVAEFEDNT